MCGCGFDRGGFVGVGMEWNGMGVCVTGYVEICRGFEEWKEGLRVVQ